MTKDNILAEYYRAEIYYKAMAALLKSEGIHTDNDQPEQQSTETVQPKPITTEVERPEPVTAEPGIVYNGKTEYTVSPGSRIKFSVDFNGVTSTSDYRIMPYGSPTYVNQTISAQKTNIGYRVDFDITAVRAGQGSYKMYIKTAQEKTLTIIINVR